MRFWDKFKRTKYLVVEVEKPRQVNVPDDPEIKKAIETLQFHIGFQHLMAKLRFNKFLLERHLKENHHADLHSVVYLQSGIHWIDWLEKQVQLEVSGIRSPKPVEASPQETEVWDAIEKSLELVGIE